MVRCALLRGRCDKVFLGQEDLDRKIWDRKIWDRKILGQEDFGRLLVLGRPEVYFPAPNLPVSLKFRCQRGGVQ